MTPKIRMAYLVSRYPSISHTFILNEVRGLRAMGFDIHVASVNAADRAESQLTVVEALEMRATRYLKSTSKLSILSVLFKSLLRAPFGSLRAARYALALAGTDIRAMLWSAFYFVEALLIADWMRSKKLDHLHVHFATPASTVAHREKVFSLHTLHHRPRSGRVLRCNSNIIWPARWPRRILSSPSATLRAAS